MSIETAFRAMIAAAIGTEAVSPLVLPQGYEGGAVHVTYQVITAPRDYVQEGPDDITTFRFQTDIYGGTYEMVRSGRDAMALAMSGAYNQTWDGLKIQGCFIDNERDNPAGEFDTPGPRLFRKTLDWMVTAKQR